MARKGRIATNGSLTMSKKQPSPVRQAVAHHQDWQDDVNLNEEVVDDIDHDDEHYEALSEQNHYSSLRKGNSRYQRNPRAAQLSHFSQFSRLPPGIYQSLTSKILNVNFFLQFPSDRVWRTESCLLCLTLCPPPVQS